MARITYVLPTNAEAKRAMVRYARKHGIGVPEINKNTNGWGGGAEKLAWRIGKHRQKTHPKFKASSRKTVALCELVGAYVLRIREHDWEWRGELGRRIGPPRLIVEHNQGGEGSTEAIHLYHRDDPDHLWRGIAYMFHVRLNGEVHRGRPEWAIGGHAKGAGDCIGVCHEGNYDSRRVMPAKQLAASRALNRYLKRKYHVPFKGHGDLPDNYTSCPGRHFPFDKVVP